MHEDEHRARAPGDDPQGSATQASEQAKQRAERTKQQVEARLEERAAEGRNVVAREAGNLGRALRRSAEELQQERESILGGPLHQLANMFEDVSSQVGERRPRDLLTAIEDFGRRQPLLFFGASVAAGFAATRFMRSGQEPSEESPRLAEESRETPDAEAGEVAGAESIGATVGQTEPLGTAGRLEGPTGQPPTPREPDRPTTTHEKGR